MKPLSILGLLTLTGLLLLGLLGGVPTTRAAGVGLAPARPDQGMTIQRRPDGNTPACDPGVPCETPSPTPICQPAVGCSSATPTPICQPAVGCPSATPTPRCIPGQTCGTPTATATPDCPSAGCASPTATPCDPALPCGTPTATATPICQPATGCPSPTPTPCIPRQTCGTATATPTPQCTAAGCPSPTPTPCDPTLPCGSPTATPTPGCAAQPCTSPTPTCQPGVICGSPTATPTRPTQPTKTPTGPTATPTCHPGSGCESPTATATRPTQPTNTPTGPTATPTCQPGVICGSPTPTRPTQPTNTPDGPTATPTCQPGALCGSPTPTRTPQTPPTRTPTVTRTPSPSATRTPPCVQPPANMSAWYPLDEPVGPIAGEIIGGVNGVHVGGPVPVPGKVAGALSFDGINDYVKVPNNAALNFGTTDFSIDTWIKTQVSTGFQVFIDKRTYAPIGYELMLYNGRLLFQMADSSGFSNYWNPVSVNVADGNWHLVAVTVRRTGVPLGQLYVDGVVVASFSPRLGNITNVAGLWLGRHHPNALFPSTMWFRGSLDEVEFFKRALTATEIGSLWTAGSAGKCKPGNEPTPTPTRTPGPCHWCYIDVAISSPFYPYVTCLTVLGVVGGYPCGSVGEPCVPPDDQPYFRPGNGVTRGQVAKIVAGAAGFAEQPTGQTFADVPPTHTFYLWIEQMGGRGIINGYPCGGTGEPCDAAQRPYFRPAAPVTRGQLAKIAANAAGYAETIPVDQQTFADVLPGSSFWLYAERIALHDVISGYPCGGTGEPCDPVQRPYYRPAASVTRGQTAKIVANTFAPDCDIPTAP